jgi:hypothetical protein
VIAQARRLLAVLRHRDFRLLWLAGATSVIGDRIVTVAPALFVIDLTGSASDLGIVLGAYALPLVAACLMGVRPRVRGVQEVAAPGRPRRGARGLPRGALAHVGVGDAGGLLRRAVRRARALGWCSARWWAASITAASASTAS